MVADQFRQLQSNFYLMIQLGYAEAIGGWEAINESNGFLLAVTAQDVMDAANKYLTKNNSSVAIYHRAEDAAPIDDELAAFGPQEQMMIKQALAELDSISEEELLDAAEQMKLQAQQVPQEYKPVFDYLLKKLQEKIDQLPAQNSSESIEESKSTEEEVIAEPEPLKEGGVNLVEKKKQLELTPQQLAQATQFLANIDNATLEDAKQIQLALQMAVVRVSADELPILEYVLAKYTVRIAELQSQTSP